LKSAVQVHGTLDKATDQDQGWDVEIAIPWVAFAKNSASTPPKIGDEWRMNFYAMHQNNAVGWSATMGQGFHRAARVARVHFGTAPQMPAPVANGSANPAGLMPGPHIPRMRVPGMVPHAQTTVPTP